MTGIERLRMMAKTDMANGYASESRVLSNIADKIEREHMSDLARYHVPWSKVQNVMLDMERHVLGHEGMDDSPVARWARELRAALGGEERDPSKDVSMSAYDLLPEEEREAIAWVREHGGLDAVKAHWSGRVALSHVHNMAERHKAKVTRMQSHIEHVQGVCKTRAHRIAELNKAVADMRPRLMPEGMEWPRFEDGELVSADDEFIDLDGDAQTVRSIRFLDGGIELWAWDGTYDWHQYGERVKRPVPKVLDADGAEIRVGDTVYHVKDGSKMTVFGIEGEWVVVSVGGRARHDIVTHRAPVLAADGKPLREGETVWYVPTPNEAKECKVEELPEREKGERAVCLRALDGTVISCPTRYVTHERPDSWERLAEDVANASCPDVYCANHHIDASDTSYEWAMARDIVRRAKALAGDA